MTLYPSSEFLTRIDNDIVRHATIVWTFTLSPVSLAQPDPYAGGEGLVTCYTRSCSAVVYRPAPIRLQLFCVAIVTRGRNNRACHSTSRAYWDDRQARAAQYKPNVTSRKTDNYCSSGTSPCTKSPDPLLPRKGLAARD